MNKITTNSQCECNVNNDTALRLVAGNDFTMRLRLTKKDGELIVPYDLTDAQDLTVNAFGHSGDSIELDSFIEDSSHVIVSIDADEFESYIPYSIEIKWYDEPYDRRSCAANLFMFVTTQQEANETQDTIVAGPYDYQIEITNDVAYVIVGAIPSTDGAVTEEELEETLENYVTNSSLSTTLNDYVTDNQLLSTLQSYATTQYVDDAINDVDLTDYYNKTEIDTTLQSYINETELSSTLSSYVSDNQLSSTLQLYATTQYVDDAIEDIDIDTSNFYTKTEIDTTLQSYVLDSDLSTTLANYVTDSELSTTLNPYVTDSELSTTLNPYVTETELDNTLQSYATIEYVDEAIDSISGGGSGVSEEDWDNSNEAIAKELTDNRLEHLSINDRFNNYYTNTQSDSRYSSKSWANNKFVTIADDINRQEAIANALSTSVQSTTIHNIVQISQTDYDALTTKDTNTLYIII